jgi:hypothetical protein
MTPPPPPETLTERAISAEILNRLDVISLQLAELVDAWRAYQPIAESFGRGGILGARAAARQRRKANGHEH